MCIEFYQLIPISIKSQHDHLVPISIISQYEHLVPISIKSQYEHLVPISVKSQYEHLVPISINKSRYYRDTITNNLLRSQWRTTERCVRMNRWLRTRWSSPRYKTQPARHSKRDRTCYVIRQRWVPTSLNRRQYMSQQSNQPVHPCR